MLQDDTAHLSYLVGFCVRAFGLEVKYLFNAVTGEDVVTASDSFIESQTLQKLAETVKWDFGVRCTS